MDDLVGHEFTHGVLDHEARLFYDYQSGALNESFADIFGEGFDLLNSWGDDRASVRWLICTRIARGENWVPAFAGMTAVGGMTLLG